MKVLEQHGLLSDLPRPYGRGLLAALVLLIAAAQFYEITALLEYVINHDTRYGYGTPVKYEIEAAETAVDLGQKAGAAEVILLAEGEDPRIFEMADVANVLLYDTPHRTVDVRTALVLPDEPAVYWSTFSPSPGETLLSNLVPSLPQARVPLREGARSFDFYLWSGDTTGLEAALGTELLPLAEGEEGLPTWANGAQLVAVGASGPARPGETLDWTLVWRVTETSSYDMYYHWFNHLIDREGQVWGQKDGPSYLPRYWRVGDTVINWFQLAIAPDAPPGSCTMRVGMYAYPAIENVPLADGRDWIELGVIEVGR